MDKHGKIRLAKSALRCGNAIVLDVWLNMFMVRIRALQRRVIWVGLRIVPIYLLVASPDLVTIPIDDSRQSMIQDSFTDH